jgi:ATP-dependent exoDNAse (exonuclease V) beta subunit
MLELSNALREAGVSFVNKTFNQKINMFPEVSLIVIFYQSIFRTQIFCCVQVQFLLNFLIALVEPSNAQVLYQLLGSKMYR